MKKETNMTTPKTVLVGDRIRYESAAGTIRGEVSDVEYAPNANGDIIPWIIVRYTKFNRDCFARLPGNSLEMYKFKVIFRDCTNYNALAERYAYERQMEM